MEVADYKKMFDQAKADLIALRAAKANLENQLNDVVAKIDAMTKTYNAIAPLVGEDPVPGIMESLVNTSVDSIMAAGITAAVRSVLEAAPAGEKFTAAEMRDRLAAQGWKWEKYNNPQGTVYTVLTRLVQSGVANEEPPRPNTTGDGAKCFSAKIRIVAPPRPPSMPESATKIIDAMLREEKKK